MALAATIASRRVQDAASQTPPGVSAVVVEYCDALGEAWGAADLTVSWCGAGTVGELWANRVPSLLLPYPHHTDQHQRMNARPLADAGGAVIVDDLIDPARNLEAHGATLMGLLSEPSRLGSMRAGLHSLGPADGSRVVATRILDLGALSER